MPTLRDIRRKIAAVKKTQQITKAMNMVAAAKLRGAQQRMENFRPYAQTFTNMLGNLASRIEPEIHPFFQRAPMVEKVGLVLMTADRGLCGSFNVNLINAAVKFAREKKPPASKPCITASAARGGISSGAAKPPCPPSGWMCGTSLTSPTPWRWPGR